jgi:hypothetical protein
MAMESPLAAACEAGRKVCGEKISDAYSSEWPSRIWFFDDQMCFAATCPDHAPAEDFRDDLSGIARAVHTKVSKLIRRKTLGVESAKAGFIAKERSASHGHAARE